jgi:hypothetical protein
MYIYECTENQICRAFQEKRGKKEAQMDLLTSSIIMSTFKDKHLLSRKEFYNDELRKEKQCCVVQNFYLFNVIFTGYIHGIILSIR